jgi:hypothetical protein
MLWSRTCCRGPYACLGGRAVPATHLGRGDGASGASHVWPKTAPHMAVRSPRRTRTPATSPSLRARVGGVWQAKAAVGWLDRAGPIAGVHVRRGDSCMHARLSTFRPKVRLVARGRRRVAGVCRCRRRRPPECEHRTILPNACGLGGCGVSPQRFIASSASPARTGCMSCNKWPQLGDGRHKGYSGFWGVCRHRLRRPAQPPRPAYAACAMHAARLARPRRAASPRHVCPSGWSLGLLPAGPAVCWCALGDARVRGDAVRRSVRTWTSTCGSWGRCIGATASPAVRPPQHTWRP